MSAMCRECLESNVVTGECPKCVRSGLCEVWSAL